MDYEIWTITFEAIAAPNVFYLGDQDHFVDSANDEDMLRAAGISVAMGNATESVKALCDHLTTDAAESGVAAALGKLLTA